MNHETTFLYFMFQSFIVCFVAGSLVNPNTWKYKQINLFDHSTTFLGHLIIMPSHLCVSWIYAACMDHWTLYGIPKHKRADVVESSFDKRIAKSYTNSLRETANKFQVWFIGPINSCQISNKG